MHITYCSAELYNVSISRTVLGTNIHRIFVLVTCKCTAYDGDFPTVEFFQCTQIAINKCENCTLFLSEYNDMGPNIITEFQETVSLHQSLRQSQ